MPILFAPLIFKVLVKLVISQSTEIYLSVLLANLCHKKMWGPSVVTIFPMTKVYTKKECQVKIYFLAKFV